MQFLCSIIITNLILSLKARIIKISFIDKTRLGIKSQLSVLEKVKPLIPENNFEKIVSALRTLIKIKVGRSTTYFSQKK